MEMFLNDENGEKSVSNDNTNVTYNEGVSKVNNSQLENNQVQNSEEKSAIENIVENKDVNQVTEEIDNSKEKRKKEKKKKIKEKKKMKLAEKIFVAISILFVLVTIFIYAYRTVYFYRGEHPKKVDNSLAEHILKKGVTKTGDGLYLYDNDNYYYKGQDVNNYVWYSGRMWRIISIDDKAIKMITEDSETSLVWGMSENYKDSYIYNYLRANDDDNTSGLFLKTLDDYFSDINEIKWGIGSISLDNPDSPKKIKNYAGLLTVSEYLRAGGKVSYLNNGSYFWTANTSLDGKPYYIFSDGGINNEVSSEEMYYSYGVRPVIELMPHLEYESGNGTKEKPYMLKKERESSIINKAIGEYVNFGNYKWRIVNKDLEGNTVKLILDGVINDGQNNVISNYHNIYNYLNNSFINGFDRNKMESCLFYNSSYGKQSSYDYTNVFKTTYNVAIGIPSISDSFVNQYSNYWLSNPVEGLNGYYYVSNDLNRLIADEGINGQFVRPVVCLKGDINMASGKGLENDPYIMEE